MYKLNLEITAVMSYNGEYKTITICRLELGNNCFANFQKVLSTECLDTKARQ